MVTASPIFTSSFFRCLEDQHRVRCASLPILPLCDLEHLFERGLVGDVDAVDPGLPSSRYRTPPWPSRAALDA